MQRLLVDDSQKAKALTILQKFGVRRIYPALNVQSIQHITANTLSIKVPFREIGAGARDKEDVLALLGGLVAKTAFEMGRDESSEGVSYGQRYYMPCSTPEPNDILAIRGDVKLINGQVPQLKFLVTREVEEGDSTRVLFGTTNVSFLPPTSHQPPPALATSSSGSKRSASSPSSSSAPAKLLKPLDAPNPLPPAAPVVDFRPLRSRTPPGQRLELSTLMEQYDPSSMPIIHQEYMLVNVAERRPEQATNLRHRLSLYDVTPRHIEHTPMFLNGEKQCYIYYFDIAEEPTAILNQRIEGIRNSWTQILHWNNILNGFPFISYSMHAEEVLRCLLVASRLYEAQVPRANFREMLGNRRQLERALKNQSVMRIEQHLTEGGRHLLASLRLKA